MKAARAACGGDVVAVAVVMAAGDASVAEKRAKAVLMKADANGRGQAEARAGA